MQKSILYQLFEKQYWIGAVDFFEKRSYRQKSKLQAYREILENEQYLEICNRVVAGQYEFKIPLKLVVNKLQTGKKKTVYLFDYQDDLLLKVINKILTLNYAGIISPACHSFQKGKGAKTAFKSLLRDREIDEKYCFKTDIHNFFNSVSPTDFVETLPKEIKNDKILFQLIKQLLLNDIARSKEGQIIHEPKGLMAGCPLSPFLSNIYLRELDNYFINQRVSYVRYSDDIVLFDNKTAMEEHRNYIVNYLQNKGLIINQSKTSITSPGETAVFLGFAYQKGNIDLSPVSVEKMKGKVKRLSRSFNRRIARKKISETDALKRFIGRINRKLYGIEAIENELCWAQWFFPVINTDTSLGELDKYIQERLRYSLTGKYSKSNYRKIPYEMLKEHGYIPLRSAYFAYKKGYDEYLELINKNVSTFV